MFRPGQITTSSVRTPRKPEELGMEDFLQLMMAQMTNQDIFNPVSDTDFIAQMAQFSTLQGMNALLQHQLSSYAVSYVGKNVLIADLDERGNLQRFEGIVERVTFSEGQPMVFINGKGFELHKVMEIRTSDFTAPPQRMQNTLTGPGGLRDLLNNSPTGQATPGDIVQWKTELYDQFHTALKNAVGALNTNAIAPADVSTLIDRMKDLEVAIEEIRTIPATGFPLPTATLNAARTPIDAIVDLIPRLR